MSSSCETSRFSHGVFTGRRPTLEPNQNEDMKVGCHPGASRHLDLNHTPQNDVLISMETKNFIFSCVRVKFDHLKGSY